MIWDEIEVPKELRQFMMDNAEETSLGKKNGAKKQYRYGNLHIREYDKKYLVHMDKVDPRKNPLGHLVADSPEVLVGLACATIGATNGIPNLFNKNSNANTIFSRLLLSLALGYIGYSITKKIKN